MLETTRAKELLEEKMNSYLPGAYGSKARASYARLKVFSSSRSVPAEDSLYETARNYLKERGELLEAKPNQRLLAMIGSGRKNQNPTVVELAFADGTLCITAWAKEGLIRQRSSEKAISSCLEALKLG